MRGRPAGRVSTGAAACRDVCEVCPRGGACEVRSRPGIREVRSHGPFASRAAMACAPRRAATAFARVPGSTRCARVAGRRRASPRFARGPASVGSARVSARPRIHERRPCCRASARSVLRAGGRVHGVGPPAGVREVCPRGGRLRGALRVGRPGGLPADVASVMWPGPDWCPGYGLASRHATHRAAPSRRLTRAAAAVEPGPGNDPRPTGPFRRAMPPRVPADDGRAR